MPTKVMLIGGGGQLPVGRNLEVEPGVQVRLFGVGFRLRKYERVFAVGDMARHYQSNWSCTGPIREISKRHVIILDAENRRVKMSLLDFERLNHSFEEAKSDEHDEKFWEFAFPDSSETKTLAL